MGGTPHRHRGPYSVHHVCSHASEPASHFPVPPPLYQQKGFAPPGHEAETEPEMRFASGSSNQHQPATLADEHDSRPAATPPRLIGHVPRLLELAIVVAVVATLAGVLGLGTSAAATVTITIGASLNPVELTVAPGTQVTWVNSDANRHRIRSTAAPEEFDSGNLDPAEQFTFTFTSIGSHEYRDDRNPEASAYNGRIIVSTSTPTNSGGGSGASGAGGSGATTSSPAAVEVDIRNRAFLPAQITVAAGGTVTWRNSDDRAHTATANDRAWDSGLFDAGGSYTQTFDTPGTVSYFCIVHPDMTATVTVVDGGGTTGAGGTSTTTPPTPTPRPSPSPSQTPAAAAGPALASSAAVAIVDFDYQARTIEVPVGTTVNWRNNGAAPHTVTATDRTSDSGIMFTGDTYAQNFPTAGTFEYFCTIHPEMVGTVLAGAPTSASTSGGGATVPAPAANAAAGGGSGGSPSSTPDDASSNTAGVSGASTLSASATAIDFGYLPETIEAEVGTTVTWENSGAAPHTITARDQSFDSGLLFTGDTYNQTYTTTGTFEYFCTLHPNMVGTVLVHDRVAGPPTNDNDAPTSSAASQNDGTAVRAPADGKPTSATSRPDAAVSAESASLVREGGRSLSQLMLTMAFVVAAVVALVVGAVLVTSTPSHRA